MYNYILKINKHYISQFTNNINKNLLALTTISYSSYLKIILKEINKLFNIISRRQISKRDIPKLDDYPSSSQINTFLDKVDIDLDKMYTSQSYIASDIQNVANYNSLERESVINKVTEIQHNIKTLEIINNIPNVLSSKIVESFNTLNLNNNSSNVTINNGSLSLLPFNTSFNRNDILSENVNVVTTESVPESYKVYKNNNILSLGSYLKKSQNDLHFSLKDDKSKYTMMMVDSNDAEFLGSTQYEMIFTYNNNIKYNSINYISKVLNINSNNIKCDDIISFNANYSSNLNDIIFQPLIKIIIPIKTSDFCNSIIIDFEPNDNNELPQIIKKSSILTDINNSIINISHVNDLTTSDNNGRYELVFDRNIIPKKLELMIQYVGSNWCDLTRYYMSIYKSDLYNNIELTVAGDEKLAVSLRQSIYIPINTISNQEYEISKIIDIIKTIVVK